MADEPVVVTPEAGEVAAPAPDVTATPVVDGAATPEAPAEKPSKTFTQEELDDVISKRLAKERRKWEREHPERVTATPTPAAGEEPDPDAEVAARAEKIANEREQARREADVIAAYQEREETVREKYDDFEQVALNPRLPISMPMAATIRESEIGPEILYHLGQNPAEAKRISQLSPLSQAKEIGKLETKLASNPPARKVSAAPAPIAPLNGKGSSTPTYDTTDPRSIQTMDTATWIQKERERQIKKQGHQPPR